MKQTLTILLVCIYALRPCAGPGGIVVCQGDDGHVELELAQNGQCGSESHSESEPIAHDSDHNDHYLCLDTLEDDEADHCGSCTDTPFGLIDAYASRDPINLKLMAWHPTSPVIQVVFAHQSQTNPIALPHGPPRSMSPHWVHAARTVILQV